MPYRDWHSVRIRNWRQAVPGTLRIKRIKGHPGLRLLVGKLRADGPMTMFGWRFRRDRYSLDEARGWIAKYKLRATHYSEATDEGPLGQGQKAGNTGVMVALMLPAATAQALTRQSAKFTRGLDQVPAEDMHITLALLGDIADGSFERNDAEALYVAVARVAKMWPAIAGVFNGAGYFIGGEGDEPLVALFDSPALPALREDLLARLRAIGVPAQQDHGFTPHTTLAYAPAGDKHGEPLLSESVPATFESLVVAIGNERRSFPLTGTTTAGKAKMLAWAVEQLDEPALDDVLTALKHYGPGPHPSGSPQKSHAGDDEDGDDEDGDAVYAEAFSPKRETAVAFGPQVALAQQAAAISEFLRRDGERYTADQIDYLFETKRGPTGEIRSVKPQVGAFWVLPDGDIVTAKSRSGHYPHNDSALRALAAIGEKPAGEPYRALVKKGLAAWHSTSYEHRFFLPAKLTRAQRDTLETLFYRHGRMTRFDIEQEGRGMQSLDAEGAGQVIARAAKARAADAKHYGPGNHWNGTPQSVHAGGGPQGERPPKARRVIGYYWQAPVFSVTRFEDFRSLRNSSIGVCLKGRNQGQIVCAASTVPHSLMADLLKDDVDNFVRFAWSKADQSLHVDTAYAAEWDRFSPAAVDNIYKALKRLNAAGVPGDVKVIITGGKQKEALVTTVKSLSAGAKHGGPGAHPTTGSEQEVHGNWARGGAAKPKPTAKPAPTAKPTATEKPTPTTEAATPKPAAPAERTVHDVSKEIAFLQGEILLRSLQDAPASNEDSAQAQRLKDLLNERGAFFRQSLGEVIEPKASLAEIQKLQQMLQQIKDIQGPDGKPKFENADIMLKVSLSDFWNYVDRVSANVDMPPQLAFDGDPKERVANALMSGDISQAALATTAKLVEQLDKDDSAHDVFWWKDEVARNGSRDASVELEVAENVQTAWQEDSNIGSSIRIQKMASDIFGVEPHPWQKQQFKKKAASLKKFAESRDGKQMRKLALTMYNQTQRYLASQGLKPDDRVVLYRGLITKIEGRAGDKIRMDDNVLQSWSYSRDVAVKYAEGGTVLRASVPVRAIFSLWNTGLGNSLDGEVVVLGIGSGEVELNKVHKARGRKSADAAPPATKLLVLTQADRDWLRTPENVARELAILKSVRRLRERGSLPKQSPAQAAATSRYPGLRALLERHPTAGSIAPESGTTTAAATEAEGPDSANPVGTVRIMAWAVEQLDDDTLGEVASALKHGGPGRHEGTGTPQQVHAGGRGTGDTAKDARPAGTEDAEDSAGRDAKIVADANATLKALPVSERLAEFAKLSPEEQDALADATRSIQSDITERLKFAGERPELTTYRQAVVRRLDQIGDYIPEDSSVRIREHISFLGDAIQAAGIDPELGHELVMDAVDALAVQENESLGRQLGDHGTRHILADMDMALEIMELHPGSDDARQAVAVSLAAIFHDTGYLTEPSKNFMDGEHPRWSAQHYEANLKGKVTRALGSEWANKIGRMIETHAEAEIDWDREPALSAIRVADNLALFHGEKLPGLFRYVPANIPVLYSLGKGKINIDEARRRMRANIGSKGLNLSKNVKAALNRAVDEVSDKTPKFTLGMLAGEVTGMEWSEDHLKVSMRRNSRAGILQRYLDLGQRQFQKFAKAYGADPVAFAERGKLELRRNGRMLLEATITGMGQKALVEAIMKATVVPGSLLEAVGQKGVEDAAGWQSLLDVVPEAHMAGLRFVPEAADGSAFYAAGQKAVLFDPAGGANEVARAIGEHVFTHLIGEKTRAAAQRALAAWPAGLLAEEPLSAADAFSAVYETALYTKATEDDATWREVTRAVPDLADVIGENVGLVAAERAGAEKRFAEEAADSQDSEEEIDMDIEEKDGADMTDLLESFARGFKHGGPGDHATTGSSQEVHGNWARASRGGSGPKRFSSDKIGRLQSEIDDLDDKYRAASGRNAQELKRQLDAKKAELRSARGQARAKPKAEAKPAKAKTTDDEAAALQRTIAGWEAQLKRPDGTAQNRLMLRRDLDLAKRELAALQAGKKRPGLTRGQNHASWVRANEAEAAAKPAKTSDDPLAALKRTVAGFERQLKEPGGTAENRRAIREALNEAKIVLDAERRMRRKSKSDESLPAAIPDAPPDLLAAFARGLKGWEEKVTESVKEGHETDPFGDSLKHYGPGPHEGTGTTQRVHGGDETYTGNRPKRGAIRKIADLQDERYYLMSDSQDVDETLAAVGRRDAIGEYDGLLVDATMDYNEVWGFNGTPRLTKDAVLLFDGVYGDAASRARRRRSLGREKQLESGQKHGGPEPHATTGTPQSVHGNWSDAGVTVRLMEEETRKKRAAAAAKTDSKEPDDEAAWIEAFKREHGGVDPKTFYKGDMAAARQDRAWGAQFLKTHGRRPSQQDWEASFAERERGRKKPTTKTTTVKTTSAEKHYGPGKHPGTGTEQLVHGGGGKTSVGITSARPDKADSETIYRDMGEFAGQLRAIKTVSNVSVEPGEGGWEGGSEYSWVVSYRGNGEARRLLAATGKKYDQDGILIYEPAKPHESASPLFDVDFGAKLDDEQREAVQNILLGERDSGGDAIIGGWTWYNRRGQTMLRMVHVPQWSAVGSDEFENRIRKVYSTLRGKWSTVRLDKDRVKVDIMEREGDNAYDRYLK